MITEWPCFRLDASRSPRGLVRCGRSVDLPPTSRLPAFPPLHLLCPSPRGLLLTRLPSAAPPSQPRSHPSIVLPSEHGADPGGAARQLTAAASSEAGFAEGRRSFPAGSRRRPARGHGSCRVCRGRRTGCHWSRSFKHSHERRATAFLCLFPTGTEGTQLKELKAGVKVNGLPGVSAQYLWSLRVGMGWDFSI